MFSFRASCAAAALFCIGILILAYAIAYFLTLHPCPLCLLQRYIVGIIAVIFLVGAFYPFRNLGRYFIASLSLIFSLLGGALAGWQLWLQQNPQAGAANCVAEVSRLFEYYSLKEIFEMVLGSASCSQVDFIFLKLSLAGWSLFAFVMLACFSLLLIFGHKKA